MKRNIFRLMMVMTLIMIGLASLTAQKRDSIPQRKNAIKINATSQIFKTFSFFYERSLNEKFAVSMGLGLKQKTEFPRFFDISDEILDIKKSEVTGYNLTPEFRWYLDRCTEFPLMKGFYMSGFLRYNSFKGVAEYDFTNEAGDVLSNTLNAKLTDFGVGIMFGYQLIIWDRMVIDFMIFGPRTSTMKFDFSFESEVDQEVVDKINEKIQEKLGDLFLLDNISTSGGGSKSFSTSSNNPNWRYGISIGVVF